MPPNLLHDVPDRVRPVLEDFISGTQAAFGGSLQSIILFGSGAEGRLRPTSDVNLLLVLDNFSAEAAIRLQPQLEMAYATIRLRVMFLLDSEVDAAMQAFAQKFADIGRRRRVLYGPDVFAGRHVSRDAAIRRTRQVLLNLTLRLREQYALTPARPEATVAAMVDAVGPIRTCAAEILELEGHPAASPKDALAAVAQAWPEELGYLPAYFSSLREAATPSAPPPHTALGHVMEAISELRIQAELIS